MQDFDSIRNKITEQHRPSSRELEGMILDFCYYLEQTRLLNVLNARKTGSLQHLIEISCTPTSDVASVTEIVDYIERIWLEELRYEDIEAHKTVHTDDVITLEFITGSDFGDRFIYITGSVAVDIRALHPPVRRRSS